MLEPVIDRPASQVDIAPTLMEMMGIQAPNAFVGQSILREDSAPPSPVLMVGVNSASLVLDDKRCIASTYSCKKDETPRCGPEQRSEAVNHVCVRPKSDLLFNEDNGLELLSEEEASELRQKLEIIPAMQTHLETHDRLGGGEKWKQSLGVLKPARLQLPRNHIWIKSSDGKQHRFVADLQRFSWSDFLQYQLVFSIFVHHIKPTQICNHVLDTMRAGQRKIAVFSNLASPFCYCGS